MKETIQQLLCDLGECGLNTADENFNETPQRVARALKEMLSGMDEPEEQIGEILKKSFPSDGYDGMVVSTGINTYSMCPHHLLPVIYDISIGYMPNKDGRILGLSKLNRIAEVLSKRPVLQEKLTKDIALALENINPKGVAVLVEGVHLCIRVRGAKSQNSSVITAEMTGIFVDEPEIKEEFYKMIEMSRMKNGT